MNFLGVCPYVFFFASYFVNLDIFSQSFSLDKVLSILLFFSKNQLFVSLILCIVLFVYILLISAISLIISFIYSTWVCLLFFSSRVFRCAVKSLVQEFSNSFMQVLSAMHFSLSTAYIVYHKIGYAVHLFSLNSR